LGKDTAHAATGNQDTEYLFVDITGVIGLVLRLVFEVEH
jgi:hypothetical protein